jgi:hypothetical protein
MSKPIVSAPAVLVYHGQRYVQAGRSYSRKSDQIVHLSNREVTATLCGISRDQAVAKKLRVIGVEAVERPGTVDLIGGTLCPACAAKAHIRAHLATVRQAGTKHAAPIIEALQHALRATMTQGVDPKYLPTIARVREAIQHALKLTQEYDWMK